MVICCLEIDNMFVTIVSIVFVHHVHLLHDPIPNQTHDPVIMIWHDMTKKRTWDRPREDERRQVKRGIKTGKIEECKTWWIERWYIRSWGCVGCIGCVCCILHTSCVRFSRGLHAGLRYHIWAFFRYTNLSGFPGEIWVHMYSGIWVYMWGW